MRPLASTAAADLAHGVDDRRNTPDRRSAPRKRILWGGLAGWKNGDSTECIVHNLSDTGAHLQIRGPVPRTFNLVIDGDLISRACCVVWRSANRVGVKFEGQVEIAGFALSFKQHAGQCRMLAATAASVDREILLKMAEAWEALVRRAQKKLHWTERTSY
jgi:hypothetical protein